MTLENVISGCGWCTRQQGQSPPYPQTDIAKICKTSLSDSLRYPNQPKKHSADFST